MVKNQNKEREKRKSEQTEVYHISDQIVTWRYGEGGNFRRQGGEGETPGQAPPCRGEVSNCQNHVFWLGQDWGIVYV